jgi:broad specificity phosphatase PhoE|tara:strand:+ start:1670 stop:2239 length:570 start_codon:yes stop_codon:yes gene_type:complete
MKLFLIRHGKPEIIDGNFFECHLGNRGIQNTKDFVSLGKLPKPDLIFSSPYNRAIDTAKIFSEYFSVDFKILNGLKEWNLQSLDLLDKEYKEQEIIGWNDNNKVILGNESLNDVKKRILKCINNIVNKFDSVGNILIVAHGTIIDMFCSSISKRKVKISDIKNMKYLDYSIVEFKDGKFELIKDIINLN